jgi:hypothetical protein
LVGSSYDLSDFQAAQTVLDRCKEAEIETEKLLRTAKAWYALWTERRMDFPMERLREYRKQQALVNRVHRASKPGFGAES